MIPSKKIFLTFGLLVLFSFKSNLQNNDPEPAKTPEEELATFQVDDGLEVQLVASEPMIQEPVVSIFDEKGRLWVVEMRGYMNDIDGKGEEQKTGRISVLEDTDGDGKMDISKVYLDSLEMPRAIALLKNGAIIAEKGKLWQTFDKNDDLIIDSKKLIDEKYAANGLPEHSDNGMWLGIDNWFYNAKSSFRYKNKNGNWVKDSTEFRGQWGICHDDEGNLHYNYNWSQLHGDLVPPNYFFRNKNHKTTTGIDFGISTERRVYPIRQTPAVNRGYISGVLNKDGKLSEFTAACSPFVYRENTLPKEYFGNAFVCEPAGNLIKRNICEKKELLLQSHDPHPNKEFLASTDERFRPVQLASGPDGALYVTDMYRGIIQHKAYVTPYLRETTIKRNLVQPVHCGRIWRIVPKNWKSKKIDKNTFESSENLVAKLSDPNGWQRDNAQRILVENNDPKSVALLENLIEKSSNSLARFHALWTLEGMNQLKPNLLLKLINDTDILVSKNAVRLIEPFAKKDKVLSKNVGLFLKKQVANTSIQQNLQIALSAEVLGNEDKFAILTTIIEKYNENNLIRDAVLSSLFNQEFAFLNYLSKNKNWQNTSAGKEIFVEMLSMAIAKKHQASEFNTILASIENNRKALNWKQKAILTGFSNAVTSKTKPITLNFVPKLFSESDFDKNRLASLASMFEWSGHQAGKQSLEKKTLLTDEEQKLFLQGRQSYLSTCAGCHGNDGKGIARFAPTLVGSEWVLGDKKRLALIILHGIEGPILVNKKVYDAPEILPVMPAHSTLDDASITAILTYIRNEWGNSAGALDRRTVGMTRITTQGRVMPWTAKELDKYMAENQANPEPKK